MKKVALILFGVAAVVGAYLASQGTSYDLSQYLWALQSWLRRGQLKAESIVNSDGGYSKALDIIAGFEGFSAKAYPDADGYSIGYGHFIREGDGLDLTSTVTEEQAYELLQGDAQSALQCVNENVGVSLLDNQRAALISFVYNIGCGAFRNSSLLVRLNAGDFSGAESEFGRWTRSGGRVLQALVDRRTNEAELFQS